MGLSRRFQNVILQNRFAGAKSLCSVDLMRQLFDNTVRPPSTIGDGSGSVVVQDCTPNPQILAAEAGNRKNEEAAAASKMKRIRLPSPILTFQTAPNEPCKIDCFPLVDRKMVWADHLGRTFLFDAETRLMDIIPNSTGPNGCPSPSSCPMLMLTMTIARAGLAAAFSSWRGFPNQRVTAAQSGATNSRPLSIDILQRQPASSPGSANSSRCHHMLKHWDNDRRPEISSYGLLSINGDCHICISVDGVGTYCLDTGMHKWRKVGKWILPFHGRVEYVPELKLWFGFDKAWHLAAADISALDSQPQTVGSWKELYLPEEWKECKDPQLVNLGCGRFCIIRFFHTRAHNGDPGSDVDQNVAVFTGVEVVPCVQDANGGSGKVGLQMIPHKSLCHISNGITINAVF